VSLFVVVVVVAEGVGNAIGPQRGTCFFLPFLSFPPPPAFFFVMSTTYREGMVGKE